MVEQQAFNLTAKGSSPLGPTAQAIKRKVYTIKDIKEMSYNNDNRRRRTHFSNRNTVDRDAPVKEGPQWRPIDTRVRGQAAVQVSELPLPVPRYSFRVGTAHLSEDEVQIKSHLTVFNYEDAAQLLLEVGRKYKALREEDIEEREELRHKWENKKQND